MIKSKFNSFIILLTILFISCNKDLEVEINKLEEELIELKKINSLLELKNIIYESRISEILILELNDTDNSIILSFENEIYYEIPKDLLIEYQIDHNNWLLNLTLNDSSQISTFIIGNELSIDKITLNPFEIAPLTSNVYLNTPINGKFTIKVLGQDGPSSDFILFSDNYTTSHSLDIYGMYANYSNKIELTFTDKNGLPRTSLNLTIDTDKLPDGLPEFNIIKQLDSFDQNTLFLINYRTINYPIMVDPFGKIRWISLGFTNDRKYGLQILNNGNIGYGKAGLDQGSVIEYTLMGQLIREYSFYPEFESVHHDIYEMTNGNFLITVNKVGIETIEDHIIEMDRNTGSIINIWDLREILPTNRHTLVNRDVRDWFHTNAIIHDESDNSLIVSGQSQGLIKISWENELKWILSPHQGWSSLYKDYLLSPIGNDFDWSWGQHAPVILPNKNILLFDNGFGRNFGNASHDYSRVVEYSIVGNENGVGGTVSQIWEYGKERGDEMFSPVISDVDYLEKTSSILITSGSTALDYNYIDSLNITFKPNISEIETRIIEVNKLNEVLFELTLKSDGKFGSTYRAEKVILN